MKLGVQHIYIISKIEYFCLEDVGDVGCRPSISSVLGAARQPRAILLKFFKTIIKVDLAERIRMHRSRASGASNLSRYGLFCMALCCTLQSLVNALDRSKVAHGHIPGPAKKKPPGRLNLQFTVNS